MVSGNRQTVVEAGISIIGDIQHTERTMSLAKMALFKSLDRAIP